MKEQTRERPEDKDEEEEEMLQLWLSEQLLDLPF